MDKLVSNATALPLLIIILFIETALLCSCQNSSLIHCIEAERQALLKLKHSFSDRSHLLATWKAGTNCCKWNGVSCDESNGHVVMLHLRGGRPTSRPINGTSYSLVARHLDPSLLRLKYLEYLDLSANDFQYSAIPPFLSSMRHLTYLNLSEAAFNGSIPGGLGNLTSLRVLDLSHRNRALRSDDDVEWISRLASLNQLGMAGVDLSAAPNLFQVLNHLPSLQFLYLSDCGLNNSHFSRLPINSTFLASVRHLDIGQNSFQGRVPIALRNMTSLRVLDLSSNLLNSSIPEWLANFNNLVHLNLANNAFSFGSSEKGLGWVLGNMCYLKSLDLSFNNFQGKLAAGMSWNESGCVGHDLETLNLESNGISGHIPDWLGMLRNLKHLLLWGNQLNGTIPPSVGQLSFLETLELSHNLFEGAVSEVHFAKLSKLKKLSIGFNNLAIDINSTWSPPFQLQDIWMESCKLGTQFPPWLRTQFKATTLLLPNTSIWGVLPKWIKDMNFLEELDLSRNQITGLIPRFPSTLTSIDLSDNMLSGNLTQIVGHHSLLPELRHFALSGNNVNGSIPSSFCHMENLEFLQLSRNKLSGNIPDCWGYQSIDVFDLSSNNLSGVIPNSIGHLNNTLQWLHLSNNNLSGEPPLTLKNCSSLVVLDLGENALSGHVPKWVGGDSFPFLNILRLRKNKFNGTIPWQLCQLSSLQILDLAQNDLTGNLPHCFGKFLGMMDLDDDASGSGDDGLYLEQWDAEHLTEVMKGLYLEYTKNLQLLVSIDLSRNKLQGSIPPELTLLTGLIGLNLSYNYLTGNIPKKIGELEWLESLDLSANQLSGVIPTSMASLTKLSYLNLSHNNLSGPIPTGKQLQTLDDPSIYAANPLLCGSLLQKKCVNDNQPVPHDHQGNEDGTGEDSYPAHEKILFYIVIMSGFATGFWGVVGVLIFKKSWRHAYFLFLDRCRDRLYVLVALKMARVKGMIKIGGGE